MPPKQRRPLTIAMGASKGGVGKTTLAAALAVRWVKDGARVALIDCDPQVSLARWHELRGEPANPAVLGLAASAEAIALAQQDNYDVTIIDTPPALFDSITAAISLADWVIIPVKPGPIDIEAVKDVVEICGDHGKPYAFVINDVSHGFERMALGARKYFAEKFEGHTFKTEVAHRKAHASSMSKGKTAVEIGDEKGGDEINRLWLEIQRMVGQGHGK